jgi:hypothetical protein
MKQAQHYGKIEVKRGNNITKTTINRNVDPVLVTVPHDLWPLAKLYFKEHTKAHYEGGGRDSSWLLGYESSSTTFVRGGAHFYASTINNPVYYMVKTQKHRDPLGGISSELPMKGVLRFKADHSSVEWLSFRGGEGRDYWYKKSQIDRCVWFINQGTEVNPDWCFLFLDGNPNNTWRDRQNRIVVKPNGRLHEMHRFVFADIGGGYQQRHASSAKHSEVPTQIVHDSKWSGGVTTSYLLSLYGQ